MRRLTLGETFITSGGLLTFIAAFLPFVQLSEDVRGPFERGNFPTSWNAWQLEVFMAPLTWFIALTGVLIAALAAFRYLTGSDARIATFSLPQIQFFGAVFIALVMFGYTTSAKSVYFGIEYVRTALPAFATGLEFSIGGYLMFAGGIIATVGAIMNLVAVEPLLTGSVKRPLQQIPHQRNELSNTDQVSVTSLYDQ